MEKFQNLILVQTDLTGHKMAKKWWVELGDLYVSKKTVERLLKKYEEKENDLMRLGMEENEE